MVDTRTTKKKIVAKKGSPAAKKRSAGQPRAAEEMAAAGVGSSPPSISGAAASSPSLSKTSTASGAAAAVAFLNDQKPPSVPSADEVALKAETDDEDDTPHPVEDMSEENRAILKVTRFIPNGMELVNDGSKWYLVIMGQVYAIDVNFHAILEIAKDWYIKANREDSSLDAESVVITVCDAFDDALTAAQNAGASQYVRPEQATEIYPPAVERAVQRATTGVASKSDVVTLDQVTLGALSETSNPHLGAKSTTGLTLADIQRSAIEGAIASNYPAPSFTASNPYATPPR